MTGRLVFQVEFIGGNRTSTNTSPKLGYDYVEIEITYHSQPKFYSFKK